MTVLSSRGLVAAASSFVLLSCAAGSACADTLLYNPGTFPEFLAWQDSHGPVIAHGVSQSISPPYANAVEQRRFESGDATPLNLAVSNANQTLTAGAFVQASFGINKALVTATAPDIYQGGSARSNAISLWKDSFTVSADGVATFRLRVDGYVPLAATPSHAAASALYDFGIFRMSDGKRMAEFASVNFASYTTTHDYLMWLGADGREQSDPDQLFQTRTDAPVEFDITLKPYLTAGEYEMRSMLLVGASTNDRTKSALADYSHTAAFGGVQLADGVSLQSASGMLVERDGAFGYAAVTSPVPEPDSWLLLLGGSALLLTVRRSRKQP